MRSRSARNWWCFASGLLRLRHVPIPLINRSAECLQGPSDQIGDGFKSLLPSGRVKRLALIGPKTQRYYRGQALAFRELWSAASILFCHT